MIDATFPSELSVMISKLKESRKHTSNVEIAYKSKDIKTVGRYVTGDTLGKGCFATVREAVEITTRKRVALKIIHKKKSSRKSHSYEDTIKQEIELHKGLCHPNIVKLIDSFSRCDKGKICIVLELMPGGSLQELVDNLTQQKEVLPIALTHKYFVHLTEGLEYLFKQGIVHKDIKPENLLISAEDYLKISDFGIAENPKEGITNSASGSPAIQPPEVASGAVHSGGFMGDIWASGVTLYFMLSGKMPFEGATLCILYENIAKCEIVQPENLEDNLKDLLSKLLTSDPAHRFNIDQIKNHPWYSETFPEPEVEPIAITKSRSKTSMFQDESGLALFPPLECDESGQIPLGQDPLDLARRVLSRRTQSWCGIL